MGIQSFTASVQAYFLQCWERHLTEHGRIPIIIWDQAALADFVLKHQVGITVGSLYEIKDKLDQISDEDYAVMKKNAEELSKKVRSGWFTKRALETCIRQLSEEHDLHS